jgi:phosphoserine phosphatase RsbU/P
MHGDDLGARGGYPRYSGADSPIAVTATMTEIAKPTILTLETNEGPPLAPIRFEPGKHTALGRSSVCQVVLPDESVSRRHATVHESNGSWFITDTASRHGTFVNGIRLTEGAVAPLKQDDVVAIGPWTFRATFGNVVPSQRRIAEDTLIGNQRVERVGERELAQITQNRLNILMNTAAAVAGVSDEESLARIIVAAAIEGSGFPRATLLRDPGDGNVIVLGDMCAGGQVPEVTTFSKSLITASRSGEVARLTADAPMQAVESIMRLGIQTALCAPVVISAAVAAYLYLDARVGEKGSTFATAKIQHDAAAFCQAISRLCGMAMGNINRLELERRQRELVLELQAAREAQRMIMPPDEGRHGSLSYAVRVLSGRYVAGDLFDVVPLKDGRVGVFLGDVCGKGIGAAVLMAAAQTHLSVSLRATGDVAAAVREVNRYVCMHTADNKFISLWLGVFDPDGSRVTYVDAGHGHWLVKSPSERPKPVECSGGIPLGIEPDFAYQPEELVIVPGSRVVLFSDGVIEQPGPEGGQFGIQRTIDALTRADSPESDVNRLFEAVTAFAGTSALADDTTVASIAPQAG